MMNISIHKYTLVITAGLLATACSITKKYEKPQSALVDTLYRDQNSDDSISIAAMPWRSIFQDEKLKKLIHLGLENNNNLKNAIQNIVQAQASARQARLGYFPTINLEANYNYNQQSKAALNFPQGININTQTSTERVGLNLSWEADVWGKISSSKRAALANYLATDAAKQAIQTQLIADISRNYFSLLAYDEQLRITEKTLESRKKYVETIKALKEGAIVTGAAVVQSEANKYAAEVTIPDLKRSIRETENALCILLGQSPQMIDRSELDTQVLPSEMKIGVPTQLLSNRPDVKQAEYNFRSAFETTNLARTYFYPSFTLTAGGGLSTLRLENFFGKSVFYNLIGGLTQPIFNQGLNNMRLTTAQSKQIQALNSFEQSLLIAGNEVSNALFAYEMTVEKQEARKKQIEALRKAVDYTQQLLEYSSATNYTDVLTSEQNLLAAELSEVNDHLQQLQAVVDLYRALGGGWQEPNY